MGLVYRCDRCTSTTNDFAAVDDIPDGWQILTVPVKGSAGNVTGLTEQTICGSCSDELYDWFHRA